MQLALEIVVSEPEQEKAENVSRGKLVERTRRRWGCKAHFSTTSEGID